MKNIIMKIDTTYNFKVKIRPKDTDRDVSSTLKGWNQYLYQFEKEISSLI